LLVAALIAIIGFFVFSHANIKPEMMKDNTVSPQITQAPVGKVIEIEAGSFYFKPDKLTLKKGETVTLRFKATSMMHNLLIDGLGLTIPVTKSGEVSEVEFTPTGWSFNTIVRSALTRQMAKLALSPSLVDHQLAISSTPRPEHMAVVNLSKPLSGFGISVRIESAHFWLFLIRLRQGPWHIIKCRGCNVFQSFLFRFPPKPYQGF
jgi:plastocyanin